MQGNGSNRDTSPNNQNITGGNLEIAFTGSSGKTTNFLYRNREFRLQKEEIIL
jgi:hypothetical protein